MTTSVPRSNAELAPIPNINIILIPPIYFVFKLQIYSVGVFFKLKKQNPKR